MFGNIGIWPPFINTSRRSKRNSTCAGTIITAARWRSANAIGRRKKARNQFSVTEVFLCLAGSPPVLRWRQSWYREPLHFSDFVKDENTFALQVRGDSMIEDHICGGDFVLVEKTDAVKNGDIVVALVGGSDATLKRYYLESDGRVRLQPANSSMAPIFVEPSQLEIQGRLLAVMRKY